MSLSIVSNLSSLLASRSRATNGPSDTSSTPNSDVGLAVAVSQAAVASSAFASAGPILSQNLLSALQSDPTDLSTPSQSTQLSANKAYGNGPAESAEAPSASETAYPPDAPSPNGPSAASLNIVR